MNFIIPREVQTVLDKLRAGGFRALPVGGCVRDLVLFRIPHDWDITTSAKPKELKHVFADFRTVDTGIRHGTLTVIVGDRPIEVTAFRADGEYIDGRRPQSVSFSEKLEDDLCRRDFTMNALCIGEDGEIIDLFGGISDLKAGIIRAIGEPERRFSEDALRILRALRFAACYDFKIEEQTAVSMLKNKERLSLLSAERVVGEIKSLLCGKACVRVLLEFPELLFEVVPELAGTRGLCQRRDYHCFDVYEHTLRAVAAAPPKWRLRLALLLHDVGKCQTADGKGHFYGHAKASAEISEQILRRLKVSRAESERIVKLVSLHGLALYPLDRLAAKRLLARHSLDFIRELILVQCADALAQRPEIAAERLAKLEESERIIISIANEAPALSIKQLKINGNALLALGVPEGAEIGRILRALLSEVIAERVKNEEQALLAAARRLYECSPK